MTDKTDRLTVLRYYDFVDARFPQRQKELREYRDLPDRDLIKLKADIENELFCRLTFKLNKRKT